MGLDKSSSLSNPVQSRYNVQIKYCSFISPHWTDQDKKVASVLQKLVEHFCTVHSNHTCSVLLKKSVMSRNNRTSPDLPISLDNDSRT